MIKTIQYFSRFAIVIAVMFSSCSKDDDVENPNNWTDNTYHMQIIREK